MCKENCLYNETIILEAALDLLRKHALSFTFYEIYFRTIFSRSDSLKWIFILSAHMRKI